MSKTTRLDPKGPAPVIAPPTPTAPSLVLAPVSWILTVVKLVYTFSQRLEVGVT